MKITVLGSGTSHGVPVIGCSCPVCRSADPRDWRMRASLYIQGRSGGNAVIDTGPEFRLQALRAGIKRLDAVFLTHAHADHLHGLDDIRALSREKPVPVLANGQTIAEMRERFSYVFRETQRGGGKPRIVPGVLETPRVLEGPSAGSGAGGGPGTTGQAGNGLVFTPVPAKHGAVDILGWRVHETGAAAGSSGGGPALVYLTDTNFLPASSGDLVSDAEIMIIGAIRVRSHSTHFNFEEALALALEAGARHTYITHISHEHSHVEIEEYCRDFLRRQGAAGKGISMLPAWDGLELEV